VDGENLRQVHGGCESVSKMRHLSWFSLPPVQAYYYRKYHSDYRNLPPFRSDCMASAVIVDNNSPIEIVYPNSDSKIYIPIDLAHQQGETILHAVHRNQDAVLYWHLDEEFLGSTTLYHQMALNIPAGRHQLTLVDQQGYRAQRVFEVLSKH
jgi:penicillin-binding protein 1C